MGTAAAAAVTDVNYWALIIRRLGEGEGKGRVPVPSTACPPPLSSFSLHFLPRLFPLPIPLFFLPARCSAPAWWTNGVGKLRILLLAQPSRPSAIRWLPPSFLSCFCSCSAISQSPSLLLLFFFRPPQGKSLISVGPVANSSASSSAPGRQNLPFGLTAARAQNPPAGMRTPREPATSTATA